MSGFTPLNLRGNSQPEFSFNLTGLNNNSQPSVGQVLGGSLLQIGGIFAAAAITKSMGSASGGESKTTETQQVLTPEQQLQTIINTGNTELARCDAQLQAYNKSIQDLTQKTDETYIKSKEDAAKKIKDDIDKTHKVLADKIQNNNTRIETAKTNLASAQTEFNSSTRQLNRATTALQIAEENWQDCEPEEKEKLANIKQRAEEAKETAKSQQTAAKAKLDAAQKELNAANDEKTELAKQDTDGAVQAKLNTYNALNTEATSLRTNLEGNKAQLQKNIQDRDTLLHTTMPELEAKIEQAEDELAQLQSEQKSGKRKASNKYAEADANDGNWWKRNMPSWLGGAKKADKTVYKENHEIKNEAKATLNAMGTSQKEIINTNLTKFINNNPEYKNKSKQVLAYLKDHPNAKNDEIKEHVKL